MHRDIINLFKGFHNTARKYGVRHVEQQLLLLSKLGIAEKQCDLIDCIIDKTTEAYSITKNQLFNDHSRNTPSADALKTCYVLFSKHLTLTDYQTGRYFDRPHQVVNKFLKEFQQFKVHIPWQRVFLTKFKKIEGYVVNRKAELFEDDLKPHSNGSIPKRKSVSPRA